MEKFLSQSEIDIIYKDMANIFGEEGKHLFLFSSFKAEIENTLKEMKVQSIMKKKFYNNKPISFISYEMNKEVMQRNLLAAKGFMLIFKFREFLFNEKINYRYYFQNQETGQVESRDFGDNRILEFMKFGESSILVNSQKLIQSQELKGKTEQMAKMTQYFQKYTSPDLNPYMRAVGYLNLRMVRKTIRERYAMNKGLLKTGSRKHQTFNEGHIYESLDLALTFQTLNPDNNLSIDDLMFGMFLKRDTVIASKGADNFFTNTSIKSNNASFYSYNTISNQLMLIKMMLDSKDPEYIKNQIKYLFLDDSNKASILERDLESAANQAFEKLFNEIKKDLNAK